MDGGKCEQVRFYDETFSRENFTKIIKSRCIYRRSLVFVIHFRRRNNTNEERFFFSLSHSLRSASMVPLESFARRQSEDAKDAENEADGAENEETKKGISIKRRKERRRSAGLHCQRCLKRTRKGVRVSFLTSPALVGFVSGAIAFGFSSASAFALRRGKGVLFALANARATHKSSKTKKKY